MQKSASMELHKWSENVVNVRNHQFSKGNCELLSVTWVKWKQSLFSITLLYSSTFYCFFAPFFVLEIFKFKYDKFLVRNPAPVSKFEWFERVKCMRWWVENYRFLVEKFISFNYWTLKYIGPVLTRVLWNTDISNRAQPNF